MFKTSAAGKVLKFVNYNLQQQQRDLANAWLNLLPSSLSAATNRSNSCQFDVLQPLPWPLISSLWNIFVVFSVNIGPVRSITLGWGTVLLTYSWNNNFEQLKFLCPDVLNTHCWNMTCFFSRSKGDLSRNFDTFVSTTTEKNFCGDNYPFFSLLGDSAIDLTMVVVQAGVERRHVSGHRPLDSDGSIWD